MSDWNLGLDPTPVTGTDPNEACNKMNFHDHSGVGKGEPINSQYIINTPAGDITATNTQAAIAELNVLANLGRVHVPVRQTVLNGAVGVDGYAAFLAVGTGLSVNLLASSIPLIIAFAYNFDSNYGALDYIGKVTADVTGAWSSLPSSQSAIFLYIDRNISTGALSYGYSLLEPKYSIIAPASPATDQHWFDLNSFYMKRWNGTAWENKQRVFVGECTTDASAVTSVICYAIQGQYVSGWFAVTSFTIKTITPILGIGNNYVTYLYGRASSSNTGSILVSQLIADGVSSYGANTVANKNFVVIKIGEKVSPYGGGAPAGFDGSQTTGEYCLICKRTF